MQQQEKALQKEQKENQLAAPAIELPKGGGAIRGMGEKFAANPVTGTGSMSVPIAVSPGRSGFGPQLALSYDSGFGNSPFGFGWSLSLPSVTRKTDKGLPQYNDAAESDVFILSGAEDLVPVLKPDGTRWGETRTVDGNSYRISRYRPRIEGLFARIERWERHDDPGEVHWRSISKDNILTIYGLDSESRISDPSAPGRIFSWLICETRDDKGNAVLYRYKAEDGAGLDLSHACERNRGVADDVGRKVNRYLKSIRYGNRQPLLNSAGERPLFLSAEHIEKTAWLFEAVFDYGEHDASAPTPAENSPWPCRPDFFSTYRAGFEIRTCRLCQRVLMFHHFPDEDGIGANCLVRSTDFTYRYETETGKNSPANPIYSFLLSVTQSGYQKDGSSYRKKSLPPLEFEYSQPVVQELVEDVDSASLENLPVGVDGSTYQWVDLHGEGIPGILTEQAGTWFYKRNLSPLRNEGVEFAPLEQVAVKPNLSLAAGAQFMDLAGDGQQDLAVLDDPAPGLYEHDEAEGWQPFRPFSSRLNRSSRDPNLRFIDLDGDGHADILITEDDALVWHPSLAEEGFGPARRVAQALDEEKGPRLIFADGTESIHLADMSGDGLTDLVRIRNGEVCYWPNLGYGRFGAKVTMGSSPWFDRPDQFDQKRIRLADIDGSGTTDIIYLHAEGVRLYFNQSGNSWSTSQQLAVFPPTDNLMAVHMADLLGNGTACLVWSSPLSCHVGRQMRYVNLMGGQKPHLLVKTVNNLGAETRVEYAPSIKFYLRDKLNGKPWITKLPFPVHVVERVETFDRISRSRFVSRYAYHHGYFDSVEREFRGFGMVEQWDTEEIGNIPSEELAASTNLDAASFVPSVHTKTWFHNGAYLAQDRISRLYTHEYYQQDAQAVLLPDTVLPAGLIVEEEREACRALKGSILRQEIYAGDGTDKSPHPYSVSERNYAILPVQRKGGNRHAVFFAHPLETIDYHYERSFQPDPSDPEPDARKRRKIFDPRISHSMTLAVDAFGNVLHAAALAYPRRQPAFAEQAQIQITCTENQVANRPDEPDWYRVGVAVETRTYEITGLPSAVSPFSLADFRTRLAAATLIAYEAEPTTGVVQKRLIEQVRTLYRRNADAGTVSPAPLPLGVIESLALPCESFKLAFTPGLLAQIYGGKITAGELADKGGYSQQDGGWWIPSGRQAFAPEQFYLPVQTRDPFGNIHSTEYDACRLSVIRSVDPLGNTVLVRNNYRTLQPEQLSDPNGNRSQVRFDALGMVVGTAVMGKENETLGDSFANFKADLSPEEIEAFFAADNPRPLAVQHLGTASTRIIYDLDGFRRSGKPACAAAIARETHVSDLEPGQVSKAHLSFVYSDGFGREAQTKTQAEPGPIVEGGPVVNPRWVGTGAKIYNNKGKPVRQYEPFFSPSHQFGIERWGISSTLFYDPAERVVATLHPNQTWEKVVFDPWQQTTWDVNDTVLLDPRTDEDVRSFFLRLPEAEYWPAWHGQRIGGAMGPEEKDAAEKAACHAGTPTTAHFDSLGRAFLTIADNGGTEKFRTHVALDIKGNQRAVTDALDRVVIRYGYDILGSRIHQASIEAGERWTLNDAAGKPLRTWDSRGFRHRMAYDALRRPIAHYVSDNGQPEHQIEKTVYGDTPGALANPEQNNHRGKPYQVFDSAGVVVSEEFDFKGNLLRSSRQLTQDYKGVPDWSAQPALEEEIFSSSTRYDALNRPIQLTAPRSSQAGSTANVIRPAYNEAKLLEQMHVWLGKAEEPATLLEPATASFQPVTNIDYDAKGQRSRIAYGNGTTTDYAYDEKTFRLTQLKTTRAADGARLQDLRYAYDPAGNITRIRDEAQQTVFFRNQAVEPHCDYTYDALYRLIAATGREHIGQATHPESSWSDEFRIHQPHPHDGQALRRYLERYLYDAVGNFAQLEHQADSGNWTRSYAYEETSLLEPGKVSNRLSKTILHPNGNSPVVEPYSYDAHGNMTRMPHLPLMAWDFRDQLCASSRQAVSNGSMPEITYYVYDSSGQRVRKVTEGQAAAGGAPAKRNERIYLGGFEVYREYKGGSCALERESLHLMDDKQRIALVETKTLDADSREDVGVPLLRYQLGNHLGSASLELDKDGAVISYEEYHPYGSTAFQAGRSKAEVSLKRYRYTGMERDEETGLNYHGARYYAGWLGRWMSCDPIGIEAGINIYAYCNNNPINSTDITGTQEDDRTNWSYGATLDSNGHFGIGPFVLSPSSSTTTTSSSVTCYGTHPTLGVFMQLGIGQECSTPNIYFTPSLSSEGRFFEYPATVEVSIEEERSFWSRGGSSLFGGTLALGGGALILMSGPIGWFGALSAALLISGGTAVTSASAIQLGASYSGNTTAAQDRQATEGLNFTLALSSPGGLIGATGRGIAGGNQEEIRSWATYGSLIEGGATLSYGLGSMAYREYQFARAYTGSTYTWNSTRTVIQETYGLGDAANRMRPNFLFSRGREYMDLSHFIPQRSTRGYESIFNRPWNVVPMWATDHALIDSYRFQFMTRAFKDAYSAERLVGLPMYLRLTPPWMLQSGYGVYRLGAGSLSSSE